MRNKVNEAFFLFAKKRALFSAAVLLSLNGLALTATHAEKPSSDKKKEEVYRHLNLFGDVFEKVKTDYVEKTEDKDLVEAAINGMLTSLDPHSGYLNPESFEDMRVQTKGEFGGLGIEVTLDSGFVKVVSPIDDTPAAKAGLQAGDYITRLDDEQVLGMTLQDAVNKMRGEAGSKIKLTVQREGTPEPLEFTLKRAIIEVKSVRAGVYDNIGYIRVTAFNENTYDNLVKYTQDIRKDLKENIRGYVLDLRNNPGGLLDQAVAVSDAFLERGEIVSTRTRDMAEIQRFNAEAGDLIDGKPLAILINGGSASASEIVAGALKDHRRGVVIGTRSFGKGSVQTVMPLAGGGALRLTTARYYTPSGESIQAKGITPDAEIKQAELKTAENKRDFNEADLPHHLVNEKEKQEAAKRKKEGKNKAKKTPSGLKIIASEALEKDYQLKYAFDLMHVAPILEEVVATGAKQKTDPVASQDKAASGSNGSQPKEKDKK